MIETKEICDYVSSLFTISAISIKRDGTDEYGVIIRKRKVPRKIMPFTKLDLGDVVGFAKFEFCLRYNGPAVETKVKIFEDNKKVFEGVGFYLGHKEILIELYLKKYEQGKWINKIMMANEERRQVF